MCLYLYTYDFWLQKNQAAGASNHKTYCYDQPDKVGITFNNSDPKWQKQ